MTFTFCRLSNPSPHFFSLRHVHPFFTPTHPLSTRRCPRQHYKRRDTVINFFKIPIYMFFGGGEGNEGTVSGRVGQGGRALCPTGGGWRAGFSEGWASTWQQEYYNSLKPRRVCGSRWTSSTSCAGADPPTMADAVRAAPFNDGKRPLSAKEVWREATVRVNCVFAVLCRRRHR